jgi:GNAT superfamily N-acetyltransferase
LNELDRVEAQAFREITTLSGGRADIVGGALCISISAFSSALPIGEHLDIPAVLRWFAGAKHTIATSNDLSAHGYTPGYALMKFERDDAPAPAVDTQLRIEKTLDEEAFTCVCAEGTGLNDSPCGFVGAPGFHCFIAWDGDEPASCAALYLDSEIAWLGVAVTRPEFRGRGGQRALLSARIDAARALGVRRLTTETGERVPDKPDQSYRNILRAGFREAYLRPTWQSPS